MNRSPPATLRPCLCFAIARSGIAIPLITPGLPEFERSNQREELLLAIAVACAAEYGFSVHDDGDALLVPDVFGG